MKQDEEHEHEDDRPLDELLNEFLWRAYHLKKKAQAIQDDKSALTKIILWMRKIRNRT